MQIALHRCHIRKCIRRTNDSIFDYVVGISYSYEDLYLKGLASYVRLSPTCSQPDLCASFLRLDRTKGFIPLVYRLFDF